MKPIISFVGESNSGKTTIIEGVIKILKKRNYKIGVIKHCHHDFEIDHKGKDTYRMAEAGADIVVISSQQKMAMIKKVEYELSIDEIVEKLFNDVDLIITEGYKSGEKYKIEIIRKGGYGKILCNKEELLAIVSDSKIETGIMCFNRKEITKITDFVEEKLLKKEVMAK